MAKYVRVHVNLDGLLGGLQSSLQATVDVVSVGLMGVRVAPEREVLLPGAWASFAPGGPQGRTVADVRGEYPTWALRCGFRDHIEAISPFLEKSREVCAIYSLNILPEVKGRDWNKAVVKEAKEFHEMGLPAKLEHLQDDYGIELQFGEEVKSINKARNCLVHRAGVVAPRDVNEGDTLIVRWRRYELVVKGEQGERRITPDDPVFEKGEIIRLHADRAVSRRFAFGDSLIFDAQEFSEIGYTLSLFAQDLVHQVQKYGKRCGIQSRELGPEVTSPEA